MNANKREYYSICSSFQCFIGVNSRVLAVAQFETSIYTTLKSKP